MLAADVPRSSPTLAPATVLVVSDPRGYVHASIADAERALVRIGRRDGQRVVVLAAARDLTAVRLRQARGVVFVDTTGDPPLGPGGRGRLLRFVRAGGGLVALHGSSNGFVHWPSWAGLVGARFVRHPALRRDAVTVRRDVAGVASSFSVDDEFYVVDRDPRVTGATVVARLTRGDRRPLAWRRPEGRGRVFHDTLGHPELAWQDGDPRLALVRAGLRWVLGEHPR
jgi:hypothetical protein